jgi:hypothetical protein
MSMDWRPELWFAVIALGAYHGLNPGMGWPLALSNGMWAKRDRAVFKTLIPLAGGHFLSMAATLLPFSLFLAYLDWSQAIRVAAGGLVAVFGAYRLANRRHSRALARLGPRHLTLWSFLTATAHGAGLMLAPVYLGLCASIRAFVFDRTRPCGDVRADARRDRRGGCGFRGSYGRDGARGRAHGVDRLSLGGFEASAPRLAQSRKRLGRKSCRNRRRQLHVVERRLGGERLPRGGGDVVPLRKTVGEASRQPQNCISDHKAFVARKFQIPLAGDFGRKRIPFGSSFPSLVGLGKEPLS